MAGTTPGHDGVLKRPPKTKSCDKRPLNPHWESLKAGIPPNHSIHDAAAYGSFADAAVKAGDFRIALEAAELASSLIRTNLDHDESARYATCFFGPTRKARNDIGPRGETGAMGRPWRWRVLRDFRLLRDRAESTR